MQWAELPAEHMKIALTALEPQLRRDHEARTLQLQAEFQLALAEVRARDDAAKRTYRLYLGGLVAGLVVSVAMLTAAVLAGIHNQPWLAAMLSGPSVIALTTLFVLRKNEGGMQAVAASQRAALSAAQQPPTI